MRSVHLAARIARYAWAAPCTAVGLCLVAPAFLFGATARVVDGAIEVALSSFKSSNALLGALPFNAITFGHVVLATSQTELDRLRAHEQAHVRQYERWGVFFFVAYPAASFWQLLRCRRPYIDNWFEVQAREGRSNKPREA
jgi:hypothetical protein